MNILLLLPDGFSESLLATPVLRCLHHRLPAAQLYVITGKKGKEAVANNRFVRRLFVWDAAALTTFLKAEDFSFAVDLQNNRGSKGLVAALAVDEFRPQKRRWQEGLYDNLGWRISPRQHLADYYFTAVAALGIQNDGEGLDYSISTEAVVQSHDIPHSHHAGFICLCIGASPDDVQLPVALLQAICKKINHPIVLLGNREDAVTGKAIATIDPIKIYNSCGKFLPAESADLIRQSKLVIGSDTATIQLAAALKKELIVVGERDSFFGLEPYYGGKFLQRQLPPYDVIPLQKRWLRYRNKKVNVDAIVDKITLRLRKKKEQ